MTKELVIAKYQEDVTWTDKISGYKITIYDKDNDIPNIGRESHTFLYHICLNYHSLADVTVFTQGNPFDHCTGFIEKINNLKLFTNYKPLSDRMLIIGKNKQWFYPDNSDKISKYQELLGLPIETVSFPYGALMAVTKEAILSRPLSFYLNTLTRVSNDILVTHSLEYLWPQVFL